MRSTTAGMGLQLLERERYEAHRDGVAAVEVGLVDAQYSSKVRVAGVISPRSRRRSIDEFARGLICATGRPRSVMVMTSPAAALATTWEAF